MATWRIVHLITRKRFRWFQRIIRVRRIHHPRWSFGWAFPLTTWCRFEERSFTDWVGDGKVKVRRGHWKRCDRGSYHDSTTTGRF